jgi:2-polyprenyl-3-methyl-5-hydroxy-6-metoxy-1,4-benzoquinol methylase
MSCPICGCALGEPTIQSPDRLHGTPGRYGVARCHDCGAGITLPRVNDAQLSTYYPAEYGPYDERMSALERIASRMIRAFQAWSAMRSAPLSALRGLSPGRGLDVGCGRGDLASALVARGWSMAGVEPSPAACEAARGRGVDALCGTLSTIELEPAAYSAVLFMHSLEHTNDPVADLRAVAGTLVPGGLVLITVPNFGGWQARRFRGFWYHLDVPRHRIHFTAAALARALETAGFQTVAISTSSSPVGLPASLQYRRFGRCLFPAGFALRAALGLCALTVPFTSVLDRLAGPGDLLHAIAVLPGSAVPRT